LTATGNTYFDQGATGKVIANTSLIVNADAYYTPAGLLTFAGIANTFPYKLLVDETPGGTGSRAGISNGGNVTGNFGADGWTLSELGSTTPYNKWTGFGVLQQGQTTTNTLKLDRTTLASSSS